MYSCHIPGGEQATGISAPSFATRTSLAAPVSVVDLALPHHFPVPQPLQDEIKGLRVTTAKMDVETARCKELQEALAVLQHQLDVMTDSHSETLKQLELAKFFLQASIATGTSCTVLFLQHNPG